jgi:hypothetical protein
MKSRIDYGSRRVIVARWKAKQRQRHDVAQGKWIVGRFILTAGSTVILEAVREDPGGHWFDPAHPHTTNFKMFYRWRTRQAARQWLMRHPDPRFEPINLGTLRGRQE